MSMTDQHANAGVGDIISVTDALLTWANISAFNAVISLISAACLLISGWVVAQKTLLVLAALCRAVATIMGFITNLSIQCLDLILDHMKAGLASVIRATYRNLLRRKRK